MLGAISGYSPYSGYVYAPYHGVRQSAELSLGRETAGVAGPRPGSSAEPVEPAVSAVSRIPAGETSGLPVRLGADPVEMAVRMRIEYPGDARSAGQGAEAVQKAAEEGQCQTCEERKYQDGSNDPGVSFKTPTKLDPKQAAAAVRGHENEHVVREQAKARREDRKVVSQSVTYHTAICPECGRAYVSGGTTRTTTRANPEEVQPSQEEVSRTPFSAVA